MAGLLNTTYNDPRASVLMGKGNTNITDDQIRAFVNANVNDPTKILGTALANNVSISQYAKAVGMPESQARAFISQQGINLNPTVNTPPPAVTAPPPAVTAPPPSVTAPPPVMPERIEAPKPVFQERVEAPEPVQYNDIAPPPAVSFAPSAVSTTLINPKTDTVQGQMQGLLADPNSPLMVAARTRGEQFANRRGLLNTSIGAESGGKAMIDSAVGIATPDAATYSGTARENTAAQNNNAMFNSQYGLLASQSNADNAMKANMFNSQYGFLASQANADNALKAGMFNADNSIKTGMFNADNTFRTNSFNSDLSSRLGMFNSDSASKVGMFNAGTAADILNRREANSTSILNNRESLANNLAIANLDVESKQSIAELQFKSEQLGLFGEESKLGTGILDSMADRIAKISADPNIPSEDKKRMTDFQIALANNSLDLLGSIKSSGVQEMLTGFKTGAPAQDQSQSAEDSKPITQNINGFPITSGQAKLINQLNQDHGTNFKPEQVVSESEKQAIESDPIYQYAPERYMRENGIVEYTYIAKDGKQARYPGLLLWA